MIINIAKIDFRGCAGGAEGGGAISVTTNGELVYSANPATVSIKNFITEPKLQEMQLHCLKNDNGFWLEPDKGFDGISRLWLSIDVPQNKIQDDKYVTVTSNGKTIIFPDDYNQGIYRLHLTTNVPVPEFKLQEKSVVSNGAVTPDDGYDGLSKVNVNVPQTGGTGPDFTGTGYDATDQNTFNSELQSDLNYTARKYSEWTFGGSNQNADNFYRDDRKLVYSPKIDTSYVYTMQSMFNGCSALTSVPLFDTSKVINTSDMFYNCSALTSVPLFDTSKVTDMGGMFGKCLSLASVPLFDTSKVETIKYMFDGCLSLTSVPKFDTSKVTDMGGIFRDCESLKSIPHFNTSNATNMRDMFEGCKSLTTIPLLNTSKATDMSWMFSHCESLTTIPKLDTSNVTNMRDMFYECRSLKSVPELDVSKVNMELFGLFYNCLELTDLGGFKGLKLDLSISKSPKLTRQSVLNVIDKVYDFRANGDAETTREITLASQTMSLLTDDDKAKAVAKGWIIQSI